MSIGWRRPRKRSLIRNCGRACAKRDDVSGERANLFAESLAKLCGRVFAVELRDETGADLGGTHCFALVSVGAITKSLLIHYLHHFQRASLAFGSALRQRR